MKALSLSQPWLWSMFDPIADKGIENRSWPPPIDVIDTVIALHAAKSWSSDMYPVHVDAQRIQMVTATGFLLHHGFAHAPGRRELYLASVIAGVTVIDRVVTKADTLPEDQRKYFFGPYGWVVPRRVLLPEPIPCAGKQGLWKVPEKIEAQIREQLAGHEIFRGRAA